MPTLKWIDTVPFIWAGTDCTNLSIQEVKAMYQEYIRSRLGHDPRFASLLTNETPERPSLPDVPTPTAPTTDRVQLSLLDEPTPIAPEVPTEGTVQEWRRWTDGSWTYTGTMGLAAALSRQVRGRDRSLFPAGFDPNI